MYNISDPVPGIDTEKMTGKSKTLSDRDFAMTSLIIGIMAGAVVIVAVALLVVYTKHKKHKDSSEYKISKNFLRRY